MIDDVAKTISTFMSDYKALANGERPKVLFVIDSLGMLLTPTDVNQFDAGDMKGDMGRKPKALTALVRNCVNMFGSYNVGLVCTNHTYAVKTCSIQTIRSRVGKGLFMQARLLLR